MPFQYPNGFTTTDEALDREHENIIALVDEFETKANNNADYADLYSVYLELVRHLSEHFATEEREMRASGYTLIDEHASEHKLLFIRLVRMAGHFNVGQRSIESAVLEFFYKWFLDHVSISDRRFSTFVSDGQNI